MRIKFDSKGGFDNALKWMEEASKFPSSEINELANQGILNLSTSTPKDTGETASGWVSVISKTKAGVEVDWINTAHPESDVNVAKLIELGHGTKSGGYVAPRPYIKQAMSPIWERLDRDVRELMK